MKISRISFIPVLASRQFPDFDLFGSWVESLPPDTVIVVQNDELPALKEILRLAEDSGIRFQVREAQNQEVFKGNLDEVTRARAKEFLSGARKLVCFYSGWITEFGHAAFTESRKRGIPLYMIFPDGRRERHIWNEKSDVWKEEARFKNTLEGWKKIT